MPEHEQPHFDELCHQVSAANTEAQPGVVVCHPHEHLTSRRHERGAVLSRATRTRPGYHMRLSLYEAPDIPHTNFTQTEYYIRVLLNLSITYDWYPT